MKKTIAKKETKETKECCHHQVCKNPIIPGVLLMILGLGFGVLGLALTFILIGLVMVIKGALMLIFSKDKK